MDLGKIFGDLKRNKYVWVVYILLTIPVNLLLALTGGCLSFILAALLTFGIPYLFGVRSVRTFLKAGTFIIIITGILYGALITHFLYNQMVFFEEKSLSDTDLFNGSVTPYKGDEATSFNYTVTYSGTELNITVYVNITDWGGDEESIPLKKAGSLYYNETTLDKGVYTYYFSVYKNDTNTWIKTDDWAYGPLTATFSDTLMTQILFGILSSLIYTGMFFYMIVLMFWYRKSAQQERKKLADELKTEEEEGEDEEETSEKEVKEEEKEEVKEEVKEEYECTACGAAVEADATECWKCGESFESDDELGDEEKEKGKEVKEGASGKGAKKEKKEVYTCTACGADVEADATECWKCGEGFEDDENEEDHEPKEG